MGIPTFSQESIVDARSVFQACPFDRILGGRHSGDRRQGLWLPQRVLHYLSEFLSVDLGVMISVSPRTDPESDRIG